MAAKKPTRPRKFKQARKDALASAKKDFSGKKQAGLKDRTLRISADDKKVLSDVKAEARGGYITDDRGNKINVKPTETAQERFLRDRREAKAEIDRMYAKEDAAEAKKTSTKKTATKPTELGARRLDQMKKAGISEADAKKVLSTNKPAYEKKTTKPKTNKPKATKPATKGFSAGKTLTPKGQAVYDDLIKQGVKPKSAMNKAIFRQEKTTPRVKITVDNKPTAPKPTAGAKAINEMGKKKGLTDVLGIEKKPTDKLSTLQKKVTAAKTTAKKVPEMKAAKNISTLSKVLNSPAGKVAKTAAMIVGPGKFLKAGALVKGALTANKAVKVTKAVKAAESGKKFQAANTARKAANVAKAEKAAKAGKMGKVKKVGLAAAGFYALDKIPTGGSKPAATKTLPQRPAGQYPKGGGKGLKLGPNVQVNAGGSTTSYTVKKGDTLSAIAKTSGVKLSEILAANPTIADKKSKYKGGSMIWSGTKVKLPTKK
jgi:LysM repeat protein